MTLGEMYSNDFFVCEPLGFHLLVASGKERKTFDSLIIAHSSFTVTTRDWLSQTHRVFPFKAAGAYCSPNYFSRRVRPH